MSDMSESLHDRLGRIRRRVRQLLWLYGLSWLAAVVLGGTFCAGTLDWLVHLDDPGVRVIFGVGILAVGTWVGWRFLVFPLLHPFSNVELALKIERRFPKFQDSLASSVQFIEAETNPRLGSPALQKRVIEQTLADVERINVADVIESREVRRVALVAAGVCLLVTVVAGLNRAESATALARLVFPFSSSSWPKKTELRLINSRFERIDSNSAEPLRVARGDTLELFVENVKGSLPDDVSMEYRFGSDDVISERLRRTTLLDEGGRSHELGVATVVAKGPLEFRAVGGDDREMTWFQLDVVPPPLIEDLQVTLTPPAYSGKEVERLAHGVGHLQGLVGTRVDIRVAVNKPLKSAQLRVKGTPPRPIDLSDDRIKLTASFVIEQSGISSYWIHLTDRQGFENSEAARYEIRGIDDLVPDIYIDKPSSDMHVTPDAVVPLRIVAKDDLSLKEIRLHYKRQNLEQATTSFPFPLDPQSERQKKIVEHEWRLSEFTLVEGMQLVFHAEATDHYNLGPEHVGRSTDRVLTVVSLEQKNAELAASQGDLLEELDRVFNMQTQAHEQVGELKLQLNKVGRLQPQDLYLLKRTELDQRQISSRLINPVDGIEAQTQQLQAELKNNNINDPETNQRLEWIADELSVLRTEHLPAIEQKLTQARKGAQALSPGVRNRTSPGQADHGRIGETGPSTLKDSPQAADQHQGRQKSPDDSGQQDRKSAVGVKQQTAALAKTHEHQAAVLESLEEMRQHLSDWRNRQDLGSDLNELIAGQQEMNRATAEIGRRTLTKSSADLTSQEQVDLTKLAGRQQKQAERLDRFREKLNQLAKKMAETTPADAETFQDAEDYVRRQATASRMREAADQLVRNQIGQASSGQQQILEDLNELQDILKNRAETNTETLVKKLKQAETELDRLHKRQAELLIKLERARQIPNQQQRELELQRLRKEQKQLRAQVSNMARRLRRLQARKSSASTARAASRMQQAEENIEQNAEQQAAEEQQEALDDLKQAQRELARSRREAEEQLARELLERIADELKDMIDRQQNVIDETVRLDTGRKRRGNWSRPQLKSLQNLAEDQRVLKLETDRLIEALEAAEVFGLALRGASQQMEKAANRLSSRKTDKVTLVAEKAAKQRFVDLIAALKPEKQSGNNQPASKQGPGENGSQGPPGDGIPQLAQLKMLKTLQENLIRRTAELDNIRQRNAKLTSEEQAELEALAGEQGQLADLARNLTQQFMEALESDDEETPAKNND